MTCKECYHFGLCRYNSNVSNADNLEICDDFKDKSKIIELPCKVGDIVYVIYDKYVTSAKVLAAYIDQAGGMFDLQIKTKNETTTGFKSVIDKDNYTFQTVFLTKAEAEKALEELKK